MSIMMSISMRVPGVRCVGHRHLACVHATAHTGEPAAPLPRAPADCRCCCWMLGQGQARAEAREPLGVSGGVFLIPRSWTAQGGQG